MLIDDMIEIRYARYLRFFLLDNKFAIVTDREINIKVITIPWRIRHMMKLTE